MSAAVRSIAVGSRSIGLAAPSVSSLTPMSMKLERQAAREAVAAYHEARMAELIGHVCEAVARCRAGEVAAYETDQIVSSTAVPRRNSGSFCNLTDVVHRRNDRRSVHRPTGGTRRAEAAMKPAAELHHVQGDESLLHLLHLRHRRRLRHRSGTRGDKDYGDHRATTTLEPPVSARARLNLR